MSEVSREVVQLAGCKNLLGHANCSTVETNDKSSKKLGGHNEAHVSPLSYEL